MEKNFNTNGSARFKNIEALTAWLENLDAEAAGKTCDRLLAIRKGERYHAAALTPYRTL